MVGGLVAFADQTHRQCREQEGEPRCRPPGRSIRAGTGYRHRGCPRCSAGAPRARGSMRRTRGDRGGPKPSARARPEIAPVQHRRDDDRREQRTNDVDERVLSYFCDATDGSSRCFGRTTMKWITREHPRVDRVACPWLIERFVDKQAEFIYVSSDQVAAEAQKRGATPYDIKDVELGHHGAECSFDAFVHKYGLEKDPAMAYMAKVIRGADTADKTITPESQGVEAILDGIRHVHYPNDQKQREASRPLLVALYAFCQKKVDAKAA